MICPKCQHENQDKKFCTNCGYLLEEAKESAISSSFSEDMDKIDEVNQKPLKSLTRAELDIEQKKEPKPLESEREEVNREEFKEATSTKDTRKRYSAFVSFFRIVFVRKAFLGTLVLLIFSALYAYIAQFIFRHSNMYQDFFYRFLYYVVNVPQEIAVALASISEISWWNVWVASVGSTVTGNLTGNDYEGILFTFHFPLILPIFIILLILFLSWKLLNQWLDIKNKLFFILVVSFLYSLSTYLLLFIFKSKMIYSTYDLTFKPEPLSTIFSSFILSSLSGLLATRFSKHNVFLKLKHIIPLNSFKSFFFYFVIFQGTVGVLMIIVWSVSNPASSFQVPAITPSFIWNEYSFDPYFYVLFPNLLVFESFYALGGTLNISSYELASFFSLTEPIHLNLLGGMTAFEQESVPYWIKGINSSIRFVWHPYALMLSFVVAFSMTKIKEEIVSLAFLLSGITLISYLLNLWLTIRVNTELISSAPMVIGFLPVQTVIITLIFTSLVLIIHRTIPFLSAEAGEKK